MLPSGIVSDAVYESWARCQRLHSGPSEKVAFQPVSASRAHLALQRNRELVQAWQQELPQLEAVLGTTSCAAMLTDATGVLVGATCVGRSHEEIMPIATRLGVNLCEEAVGTTAPGVAARTGQAVSVNGGEHFFDVVRPMHCAAAPIRNASGQVAGVLDISSETIPFSFDATAVVGLYAAAIENRLFISQSNEHLVVRFQIDASLLDSNFVALAGIDITGKLAWINGAAAQLLGLSSPDRDLHAQSVEGTFGTTLSNLASLPSNGTGFLRLGNGLMVWARFEMRAPDGNRNLVHVAKKFSDRTDSQLCERPAQSQKALDEQASIALDDTAGPTATLLVQPLPVEMSKRLRDCGNDVIERTLESCRGNVSKAAELLGVSRGLIYRRLRNVESSAH